MYEPTKIPLHRAALSSFARGRRPRWLIGGLAAVIVAVIAAGGWLSLGGSGPMTTALTQRVAIGNVEDAVTALGTIQPLQFVDVGTQVSGQLRILHVDYSATVKKGDLLAEIDPTIYQSRVNADEAQLLNLGAQLAQRQAQRSLAELQFARQQELLKENATSQDAFDSANSNLKVAVAQIAQLEAQLKQTQSTLNGDMANLGYTKIYAPMDGTVVNLIAKQGQTLNANQTAPIVLRIANLNTMTVWAQVSEADVPKLTIGMEAYFTTLGTSEKRRYGKLRKIIPTPDVINNVVLYNCLFDVENPDGDLLTQMSAQVFFVLATAREVTVVPVTALHPASAGQAPARPRADRRGGGADEGQGSSALRYAVHVVESGDVVTREIVVGVMNRMVAEVKSGLNAGEEIALDGGVQPRNGPQAPGSNQRGRPGGPHL
ncbi:MAG: efflux RND transporter periplasmic adaptor subunit [Rhodospirillaceae bacterium]|nr:efflux RND transporter periplasmic adaptor subunit [Rhodospirillaceae bacterium]